jgi:ABC-type bacteriocin/lantibiotic exporter with double-glycine peptidase domain
VLPGQKVAIIGESGKGKSTVLNVLAGFTPFNSGEVQLFEFPLNPTNISVIRSKMSWLPQETALQFDSVKEMIYAPFDFQSNSKNKPNHSQIEAVFSALNLPIDILEKSPATISGGQRQRVLLTSSLLLKKPLLITDEPTSALDESNRKRITDYIMSQSDLTVIASTHDAYWIEKSDVIIDLK